MNVVVLFRRVSFRLGLGTDCIVFFVNFVVLFCRVSFLFWLCFVLFSLFVSLFCFDFFFCLFFFFFFERWRGEADVDTDYRARQPCPRGRDDDIAVGDYVGRPAVIAEDRPVVTQIGD